MEYKGYVNDILNPLIPTDDILHRTEKESATERNEKIKSLENHIEDLKKENQVLREILTSKLDIDNESNIAKNNIDNTWKTVQVNRSNNVNNKDKNRRHNSIDVRNKSQPIFIHENEVTEPLINNRMNNDVNEYKNANDITMGIINIGRYCKEHNFNNVTISSLIYRSQKHLQHKLNAVNTMLMNRCKIMV